MKERKKRGQEKRRGKKEKKQDRIPTQDVDRQQFSPALQCHRKSITENSTGV